MPPFLCESLHPNFNIVEWVNKKTVTCGGLDYMRVVAHERGGRWKGKAHKLDRSRW